VSLSPLSVFVLVETVIVGGPPYGRNKLTVSVPSDLGPKGVRTHSMLG